jgi:hypothetical protein
MENFEYNCKFENTYPTITEDISIVEDIGDIYKPYVSPNFKLNIDFTFNGGNNNVFPNEVIENQQTFQTDYKDSVESDSKINHEEESIMPQLPSPVFEENTLDIKKEDEGLSYGYGSIPEKMTQDESKNWHVKNLPLEAHRFNSLNFHHRFSCPISNCTKSFSKKPALKNHMSSHEIPSLKCSQCNRMFKRSTNRNKHEVTHISRKNINKSTQTID